VSSTLHAGSAGWGLLVTTYGIGMGIGLVTANLMTKLISREDLVYWSMIAAAVTLFVLAGMPNLPLVATCAVVLGVTVGTTWVSGYTLLQESVADEFRGRTFASLNVLSRLALFLSLAAFPMLVGVLSRIISSRPGFDILGQHIDLSANRLGLWVAGGMVLAGGLYTRHGMKKYRLTKAMPLNLTTKLRKAPPNGVFIVLEGVEGAGKGTQMEHIRAHIESGGREVLVTREPGGTSLGEDLRRILLSHETGKLEPKTEALLFAAARAQLVATVIRPALESGKVVLCDRYIDSSVAYQGFARGLGEHDVLNLNVWATQGLFPDLVVLLHIEPESGLARAGEADRIESEGLDFHAKVADAFLQIASEHPERVAVIDASQPIAKVTADVQAALERTMPELTEPHRPQASG
jgi:dTMP kinase